MLCAPLPEDEAGRLEALRRYDVLDTHPEQSFDRFTRIAAKLFDTPVSAISLIDEERQWFKSCVGLDTRETSRDVSFSAHAICAAPPLIVPDATRDPRFATNPFVVGPPYIRFYAGAPLRTSDGFRLGTLCVVDTIPRSIPDRVRVECLEDLAAQVMEQLELSRTTQQLAGLHANLIRRERELEEQRRRWEESEQRAALALQAGQMGSWEWDAQTDRVLRSPILEQLFSRGSGRRPHRLGRRAFIRAIGKRLPECSHDSEPAQRTLMRNIESSGQTAPLDGSPTVVKPFSIPMVASGALSASVQMSPSTGLRTRNYVRAKNCFEASAPPVPWAFSERD